MLIGTILHVPVEASLDSWRRPARQHPSSRVVEQLPAAVGGDAALHGAKCLQERQYPGKENPANL